AGLGALALVWRGRFEPARYTAALAVAAIIAGWAIVQRPLLLRDVTIKQAAAPHDTLVLVIVAVLGGAVILFPSLALLFRLVLGGRLDHGEGVASGALPAQARSIVLASARGLPARMSGGCLIAGIGLLTIADAGWAHALGVTSLFGFVLFGFTAVGPAKLAASQDGGG